MTPSQLRGIRAKLDLTQHAMAKKIGISVRQLRRLEKGQRRIPRLVANSARWVGRSEAGVR